MNSDACDKHQTEERKKQDEKLNKVIYMIKI